MLEKGRTKKLALLGFTAVALALAGAAPAFAWHVSSFTSTIYCNNGTSTAPSWAPCTSQQLGNINVQIEDQATLQISYNGSPYGTVSFYLYSGGSSTFSNGQYKFNGYEIPQCTLNTGSHAPTLVWTDSANPQSVTSSAEASSSQTFTSSVVTGSAGTYFFYVVYSGTGSNGYPSSSLCEPFTASGNFPPPPQNGVPQFPLGMALLLAVAIPGLLLVRSKFASTASSSPIHP
jgi:hypothetical protein